MLAARGLEPLVIFLEASDAVLVSRFAETRRRHPLGSRTGVQASIAEERVRLAGARALADQILDTSGLSIGQLKERVRNLVPRDAAADQMSVEVITFGFKFGIPLEADLVFDVRFLTNPYWVPDLKRLSGLEAPVRDYVLGQPEARRFLELVMELLELTLPAYRAEGKSRLVIALGCTGGYHRSIVLAEELARRLEQETEASVNVFHRELERCGGFACHAGCIRGCTSSAGWCSPSWGSPSLAWAPPSSWSTSTVASGQTTSPSSSG